MFGIVDDKKLFDSIKNNSEIAFKVVYEEYFAKLTQFITRMSQDSDLAEEVVQQTMVKVWEQRDKIVLTTSLKSYLYKMSYHEYLMYLRKKSKFPNIEDVVIEAIDEISDENDNEILLEKIRREIDKLPPKCREVFILSKVEGLKYKEIAEKLNISTKTIEVHMTKALKAIREAF
ncbi:RNA polymerase sigma factor [Kaistella jeonii]|uniref:RNA polymerase sigma factor n=1 Tax=Kaistella jeonii TaxID=266749 RepID=UPI0008E9C66C|nr:RNA polymerase sigma-70 factor [Kaistella jeonii]SFC36261.1 RNA polymerase sigma-70 factor, ECF subfamily [Kaistella jeonii]VEI97309.1 Sigma-24 [Kaistella jeonii]